MKSPEIMVLEQLIAIRLILVEIKSLVAKDSRPTDQRLLREPEVTKLTGLKSTRIRELEKAGAFPKRIKVGERACAWLENEVQDYIRERVKISRGPSR